MLDNLLSETVIYIQPDVLDSLMQLSDDYVLLDIRTKEEFQVSQIKGARLIEFENFSLDQVNDLDKKNKVIVYCSVGYRSEKIGEALLSAGFNDVYNLYGGIFKWVNEGREVVTSQGEATNQIHAYDRFWGRWLEKGEKVY